MANREQLIYMLKSTADIVKPLIEDITEEESMARGEHKFNHIRWQTGHILHSDKFLLSLLGEEYKEFTAYDRRYGGGTDISDDPAAYDSMVDLRTELFEVQDRAVKLMESASNEDLEKEKGEGQNKSKVWQVIAFLCMHNFYHAGQITQIRMTLGRGRPFK